jgi:hypothetical protein
MLVSRVVSVIGLPAVDNIVKGSAIWVTSGTNELTAAASAWNQYTPPLLSAQHWHEAVQPASSLL